MRDAKHKPKGSVAGRITLSGFDLPLPRLAPGVDLSPQDIGELRLLLRGESVVDWYRIDCRDVPDAHRLLALNGFDPYDPRDDERLGRIRDDAAAYIRDTLGLRLDEAVTGADATTLLLLASGRGDAADRPRLQRGACTLLKVMHILHHLDARELATSLSLPNSTLFSQVEARVLQMYDVLRAAGVHVSEFAWSRKTRASLITKLLAKRQTNAARVFDRIRFRIVVETGDDLVSALRVMLHRCFPFNYVVPGETVNSLVPPDLLKRFPQAAEAPEPAGDDLGPALVANEFSSADYRVLNFVVDLPIRVDRVLGEDRLPPDPRFGRVVFVLSEFQVLDRATADANAQGDASHDAYKRRQIQRVRERLLREPKHGT